MNTRLALQSNVVTLALDPDRIRHAVSTLLRDPSFARAPRMSQLLSFLIEKKLAGRESDISEFNIGLEVFRRNKRDYDTCFDPVVRVQVGRLRHRLVGYHTVAGTPLGVHISLPPGSYVPVIETIDGARHGGMRRLELVPLRNLSDRHDSAGFVYGVNEELGSRLFDTLGSRVRLQGGSKVRGADAGVGQRLEGSIRVEARRVRASIRLVDITAGDIAWLSQIDCSGDLGMHLQEQLAGAICERLRCYLADA